MTCSTRSVKLGTAKQRLTRLIAVTRTPRTNAGNVIHRWLMPAARIAVSSLSALSRP